MIIKVICFAYEKYTFISFHFNKQKKVKSLLHLFDVTDLGKNLEKPKFEVDQIQRSATNGNF